MQQRLPDIERTLLSAYIDGELSASERQDVERLLESSDGARAYLRDLRAVNMAAGESFPAIPAGIAATGAIASGKLTAAAIRSAAMKGTVGNGSLSGIWGMSGLATAAALVVAGFNYLSMPAESPVIDPIRTTGAPHVSPGPVRALPVVDVDSSSFIIPAMTRSELIDFAVEGTLPIDEKRECFITVTQNGADALAVSVHAADAGRPEIAEIGSVATRRLDSVHQLVRTALIPYAKNSIAVRSDLPMLRLQVLEQLSESMEGMPPEIRRELARVRVELRDAEREVERARETLLSSRGGIGAGGGPGVNRTVLYIPIESEGMRRYATSQWTQAPAPETFTLLYNRCGVVAVDPGTLESAYSAAFASTIEDRRRVETRIVSSPGDPTAAPMPKRKPRTNGSVTVNFGTPPDAPEPVRVNEDNRRVREDRQPVSQDELDDLLQNAEKSLKKARESLRRAEEIQKKQDGDGGAGSSSGSSNPDE